MATVFESLSEGLYTAFFEPDPQQRVAALDAWVDHSTSVIQQAVLEELRAHLEWLLETRQTPEGWESGVYKFRRILEDYRLVMDIKLRKIESKEKGLSDGPPSPEEKARTFNAAEKAIAYVEELKAKEDSGRANPSKNAMESATTSGGGGKPLIGRTSGNSPNDNRSNSMNPNNRASRAAANNRSNQMNPNNASYRASRGRR